jgi:hypothetical protein
LLDCSATTVPVPFTPALMAPRVTSTLCTGATVGVVKRV